MSYFLFENKRVYYQECGTGVPLVFLHGNAASSCMFAEIAADYGARFKVILIDFLGHGKSDRLNEFPPDLWFYEAEQVMAFLHEKQYAKVNLIGSSGGALVAINVALEAPDLVTKVVAVSFEGEKPLKSFIENLEEDRAQSKLDDTARLFFTYMHGEDWESVVDHDTNALLRHEKEIGVFFHKPLQLLKAEILLTGSKEDEFICTRAPDFFDIVYGQLIAKIGHGKIHLFPTGGHPALLTNPKDFFKICIEFLT